MNDLRRKHHPPPFISAFDYLCLTKRLEEKTFDSYSSYVRLFGFYTQQSFVFTSKTGLPCVVLVLRWVLFFPEIFVSPLSEFEQHMYNSDPRRDTGSLMQLESRRAVPQASQSSQSNSKPAHFNNSTTRRPRSEKPLQTSGSCTFLSFSCFRWQTKKLSADLRHHYYE